MLCLSAKTLGAGSAGCGPKPLDQYMVRAEPATFSYVLRLVPASTTDFALAGSLGPPLDRVKPVPGKK